VIGKAAPQRSLTRRGLADACRNDVAHDAFIDGGRIDPCPAHGLADDDGPEFRGLEIFQGAKELSGGRPNG